MKNSRLLINEPPLQVSPTLAKLLGLNEAIALQQLHYWIMNPKCQGEIDPAGNKWIYNTYEEWQENNFPFWSVSTIQRVFLSLENSGVVIAAQLNAKKRDMRKYYRIDYVQLDLLDDINLRSSNTPKRDDVNNESETTAEIQQPEEERPNVFAIYEQEIGILTPMIADALEDWEKDVPAQWIPDAIREAVQNNARNWKYVEAILKRWKAQGHQGKQERKNGKLGNIVEKAVEAVYSAADYAAAEAARQRRGV